jgi:hypothetical protein
VKVFVKEVATLLVILGAVAFVPTLFSLPPEGGRSLLLFGVLWVLVRGSALAVQRWRRAKAHGSNGSA